MQTRKRLLFLNPLGLLFAETPRPEASTQRVDRKAIRPQRTFFREVMVPESRHKMIRTRGKQRRAHAKGHRASVEAFRRILEQKFIENRDEIATAMIEAAKKANTAAVRETVKLVDAIDEPEEQPQSAGASVQFRIWENELRETSIEDQHQGTEPLAREPAH